MLFFKVPRSGGEPGIFFYFRLFSLTSSTLDHSATAPPMDNIDLLRSNVRKERSRNRRRKKKKEKKPIICAGIEPTPYQVLLPRYELYHCATVPLRLNFKLKTSLQWNIGLESSITLV